MKTNMVSTRRRFFLGAGAVLSAPLAIASTNAADDSDDLKAQLENIEDVNAIRELHRTYAKHVNAQAYDNLASLFVDPAQAAMDNTIKGLSADYFNEEDFIELAADGKTASAQIHCSVQFETAMQGSSTLVEMALQQGEGVVRHSSNHVLENTYVKQDSTWKIEHLAYRSV